MNDVSIGDQWHSPLEPDVAHRAVLEEWSFFEHRNADPETVWYLAVSRPDQRPIDVAPSSSKRETIEIASFGSKPEALTALEGWEQHEHSSDGLEWLYTAPHRGTPADPVGRLKRERRWEIGEQWELARSMDEPLITRRLLQHVKSDVFVEGGEWQLPIGGPLDLEPYYTGEREEIRKVIGIFDRDPGLAASGRVQRVLERLNALHQLRSGRGLSR